MRYGEKIKDIFLVAEGEVEVFLKLGGRDGDIVIDTLGQGAVFGLWTSLSDG